MATSFWEAVRVSLNFEFCPPFCPGVTFGDSIWQMTPWLKLVIPREPRNSRPRGGWAALSGGGEGASRVGPEQSWNDWFRFPATRCVLAVLSVRGSAVVTGAAESAVISQPALCLTQHTLGMCGQGGGLVWNRSGEGQSSVRGLAGVRPAEAGLQAPCTVRVEAPLGSGSGPPASVHSQPSFVARQD